MDPQKLKHDQGHNRPEGQPRPNRDRGIAFDSMGVVRPDCAYTLEACERLFGIGRATIRAARRQGLPVRRIGKRRLIVGIDLINHVIEKGEPG